MGAEEKSGQAESGEKKANGPTNTAVGSQQKHRWGLRYEPSHDKLAVSTASMLVC